MFLRNGNTTLHSTNLLLRIGRVGEQLGGLDCEESSDDVDVTDERLRVIELADQNISRSERILYLRAKTCFDVKEYLRCADLLQSARSQKSLFLRSYSLFLSGEKQKEEEHLELKEQCPVINSELKNLSNVLGKHYEDKTLDPFGKYLYGVVLKNLALDTEALAVLIDSCNSFPWNWSSWVALASLCTDSEKLLHVHSKLQRHYMTEFFVAHTQLELQMNEEALNSYDSLTSVFPSSRYITQQISACQFNLQDFDSAENSFEQMREMEPYCIDGLDVYSNILYVRGNAAKLSYLAHFATTIDKYRPETCFIVGNYYSLKEQHLKAVLYFQRAIKLNRNYLSAWTLMGHEYVELKKPEAALYAYRKAVDSNPRDYRALYGLGQLYEVLKLTQYSIYYYHKASLLRPYDARMWCALACCFETLEKYNEAIKCYERAVANQDREGLAIKKLATLYAYIEDHTKSAYYYKMSLDRLDSSQGNVNDIIDALVALGDYCHSVGKTEEAVGYYERLLQYKGRGKEHAKERLLRIFKAQQQ